MDHSLIELNQKMDVLASQVSYLTEQMQIAERQREARSELIRDITPIANDAFRLTVEQFEEIQEYVDLSDLLRFVKRLLRNGRNLDAMLSQLESIVDLLDTVSPLADDAFAKVVNTLNDMEQKGYFTLARSGIHIMDNFVTTVDPQDIDRVAENVTPMINFARNSVVLTAEELKKPVDISYSGLLRQLRDADMRRGLALTLRILQVIGAQAVVSKDTTEA